MKSAHRKMVDALMPGVLSDIERLGKVCKSYRRVPYLIVEKVESLEALTEVLRVAYPRGPSLVEEFVQVRAKQAMHYVLVTIACGGVVAPE